ncbi:methyltransferase, FxLD system [Glycomyces salinus]|uniref:methyltransferase, FxLD system n=1 Tax=Glycomyces salinus TaxID=980294 RepID=UPI0018ED100B|nr:methyltransferase, FxLD system [Glycomyces salinus]
MPTTEANDQRAEQLRAAMVEAVASEADQIGRPLSPAVRAALERVPRHEFCPGASLEAAYANDIVRYEQNERGVSTSTVSAPNIIATMLDQAGIGPGMRVLEIGSGGYNAALISELVGPGGAVVSVDIDQSVIDRASASLTAAGFDSVRLVCADGSKGAAEAAPFDRIIVTVTCADIPPAWRDQLKPGGAIVAPLRLRSMTRTVRFERDGDRLVSTGYDFGGFVPGQGGMAFDERAVFLDEDGTGLRVDSHQPIEPESMRAAIETDPVTVWTGAEVTPTTIWNDLELWIAAWSQNTAHLKAATQARRSGRLKTIIGLGSITLYNDRNLAFLTLRDEPRADSDHYEIGAQGHGPDAEALAERLAALVRDWDACARGKEARITVWPTGASSALLPAGLVEERPCSRITVDWPDA